MKYLEVYDNRKARENLSDMELCGNVVQFVYKLLKEMHIIFITIFHFAIVTTRKITKIRVFVESGIHQTLGVHRRALRENRGDENSYKFHTEAVP